jgi:tight adherence protein B
VSWTLAFLLLGLFLITQGSAWYGLQAALTRLAALSSSAERSSMVSRLTLDARLSEIEWLDRFLSGWSVGQRLGHWIEQSGVPIRLDRMLALFVISSGLAGAIGSYVLGGGFGLIMGFSSGLLLPVLALDMHRRRRQRLLNEQLPDALDGLARALQAGNALSVSIGLIAKESPQPIATAFRLASEEMRFGASLRWGLNGLVRRIDNMDIRFFAVAVVIHGQTGGNLSALLFKLSGIIRERQKAAKAAQILSADGRLSAWILALMPFVTGFAIYLLNPGFISLLWTHPRGLQMIQVAAVMLTVGVLWMIWIVRDQD